MDGTQQSRQLQYVNPGLSPCLSHHTSLSCSLQTNYVLTTQGALLTIRTGMVFQGRMRDRVIFAINSLFDSGSITYLGLWGLAKAFDWSLTGVASFYLGLAVVCFGGTAYLWSIVEPEKENMDPKNGNVNQKTSGLPNKEDEDIIEPNDQGELQDCGQNKTRDGLAETSNMQAESDYVLIADRTQLHQIFSGPFLLTLVFTSIMITGNQWTLTTTREFLANLGDDDVDNKYLTIFTLLMPASLAALPCTDFISAKYGFHGGKFRQRTPQHLIFFDSRFLVFSFTDH